MYRIVFSYASILCSSLAFFSCNTISQEEHLPYYNEPTFSPHFFEADVEKEIPHQIADFSMTDQDGNTITEKDIEGKIHIANFFFTKCASICPMMTNNLLPLQNSFKNNADVVMLSYSVTPWMDSVAALKKYAEQRNINSPNWHLLTGSTTETYKLARQSYFAEEDFGFSKDSADFLHTEHILLIDKTKRIRGIYNGTLQLETQQLIKDINTLLKEN